MTTIRTDEDFKYDPPEAPYHQRRIRMNIRTTFEFPPIPIRTMDWSAVDDDTYDYDSPIGRGATEAEAIEDLMEQIEERAG